MIYALFGETCLIFKAFFKYRALIYYLSTKSKRFICQKMHLGPRNLLVYVLYLDEI